jgi:hypothetical protein
LITVQQTPDEMIRQAISTLDQCKSKVLTYAPSLQSRQNMLIEQVQEILRHKIGD